MTNDQRTTVRALSWPVPAESCGQACALRIASERHSGGLELRLDAIICVVPMIRLVTVQDAPVLADVLRINREFLVPWQAIRPDGFFTADGQRRAIEEGLLDYERGVTSPHVILDDDCVVGRVTLSNVVRGPFQSCNLGYWVDAAHNGRGLGSASVREIVDLAFGRLGLHRIEAGTLHHNVGSQCVLERNGFVPFGVAPAYLKIAGRWQDHVLYQVVSQSTS